MVALSLHAACSGKKARPGGKKADSSAPDTRSAADQTHPAQDGASPGKDVPVVPGPVTVSTTKGMKVTTVGSHLFSLDTKTQEFELPVRGTNRIKLVGILASPEGKRRLVLRENGKETEVFPPGWYLPGIGAVSDGGQVAVCANVLLGGASSLTKGTMPDPSAGMGLTCRLRTDGGWLDGVVLKEDGALWLTELVARSSGRFWVLFMRDRSGRLVTLPEQGDGACRVAFGEDGFGKTDLVHSLRPD